MSRERERFEEDEKGKRLKREIDVAKSMVASNNNGYDNHHHHQIVASPRRRHLMGVGVGVGVGLSPPPPGTTLNTITPCAACKLLRRRCADECPFSPYFSPHEPQKFAAVHKVFGASNVSKLLMEVPENQRADAANSLVYEANVRLRDPVYGCMGAISALQQQIQTLQVELNAVRAGILKFKYREATNNLISATTTHPLPPPPHHPNNSLVTSVAAAVIAASLPPVQSPPHHQQTTPPPPPATPPPPAPHHHASVVLVSPPPPDSGTTTSGFSSISTDHSSVPFFD